MADLTQKVHGLYTDWVLLFFIIFSKLKKVNFFFKFYGYFIFLKFRGVPACSGFSTYGAWFRSSYQLFFGLRQKCLHKKCLFCVYLYIRLYTPCWCLCEFPFSVSFGCITIPAWLLPMFKALIKTICLLLSD